MATPSAATQIRPLTLPNTPAYIPAPTAPLPQPATAANTYTTPAQTIYTPMAGGGNIAAPKQASIADSYYQIQSLLPQYQAISSLSNPFDDNYYNNIADASSKRLKDSYFNNNDSLQAQLKNQMNKRGLVGSGIEAGATGDLYKNFGNEMASLSSDLAKQRIDSQYQVATQNKQIEQNNIQNRNTISQLGLGAAGDQARTTNDFNSKLYGSNVDLAKSQADQYNKSMEVLQNLINNNDAAAGNRQDWISQLQNMIDGISGGRH